MATFEPAFVSLRLAGATAYFLGILAAITFNTLLAITLTKGWDRFRKIVFYQIIWQLIVSDLLAQFSQLFIAVPLTFMARNVYGDTWFFRGIAALETAGYFGTVHFNFVLAANRFLVFCAPSVDDYLFARPRIYVVTALVWLYVVFMFTGLSVGGCHKDFSTEGFYFFHNCLDMDGWRLRYREFVDTIGRYFPVLIIILHSITIAKLRRDVAHVDTQRRMSGISTHESSAKKAEKRFAVQCFLINATLIVEYLTFHFVPYIPPLGQWNYVINFVVNLICIFNNMISPLILFTLNDEIRRVAAKIVRC